MLGAHWLIFDEPSVMDLDRVIERLRGYGQDGVEALVEGLIWRVGVAYRFKLRTGMTWDTLYADGREAFDLAGRHLKPVSGRQLHAAVHVAGAPAGNRLSHQKLRRTGQSQKASAFSKRRWPTHVRIPKWAPAISI